MEKLSDLKNFKEFSLKSWPHINFFYTEETFVNLKGEMFQNCDCGKCSDCFRTKNNMKIKLGKLEDVIEVVFGD